ncbi:glycosyltransferase [Paenibacillus sp. NPDC056579]|uniref:glycosyltransferase n=1 Tax=Paenibacillus sp. NPDC056579 TaxID=3345871 RepID=UPI0036BFB37F
MRIRRYRSRARYGISVVTCTNRADFLHNLIDNYKRQRFIRKELIIVVNSNDIPLEPYIRFARGNRNVKVFRLPAHYTLGACLNFAVRQSKYRFIAKFDDDDYYAPRYLRDSLRSLKRKHADIVGKRAHYMFLSGSNTMLLRFAEDEHQYVTRLPGATLMFRKKVWRKVKFPNRSLGEDDSFCTRSKRRGYRVYSGGKYNFLAIRRADPTSHTWKMGDEELIKHHRVVPDVQNIQEFVQR